MKRHFLFMTARCVALIAWLLGLPSTPVGAASGPNIVFLLADDLGWGDPGCYNPRSRIPTPAMDRLAAEGMRLTDMHSPSAVCTPTRYGLMTGRYAWRTRMKSGVLWGWSPPLIETGRLTLPALLKSRGYVTGGFGKWHLGLGWQTRRASEGRDLDRLGPDPRWVDYSKPLWGGPHTAGFDQYFGIPASLDMEPYVWIEGSRCVEAPLAWTSGDKSQRVGGGGFYRQGPMAPGFHVGDVLPMITDRAIRFIEEQATAPVRRPFFAYIPLTSPHDPWLPHAGYVGSSSAGPRGDFVVQTDACVARVLEALDRLNLANDTVVVFTSDNGGHWLPADIEKTGHLANGPWRGQKSDIHEAGHRVPCLVRWPGKISRGSTSDRMVCHVDWMATLAEITGSRLPKNAAEDSFSFAGVLLGKPTKIPARESLVLHSGNGVFAIRRGPMKLVEGLGSGGFTQPSKVEPVPGGPLGQLYDLSADPVESRDLYSGAPDVVESLSAELDRIRKTGRSRR